MLGGCLRAQILSNAPQDSLFTACALHCNRFVQMSCADWRWGFFNVYDMASRVVDLDFIVFLGDWIYEYGDDQYPSKAQSRWCDALKAPSLSQAA
jgi:phosphodiesterase/alkaline phosphatase D-like protein